ncbi:ribosomal subunit interface protein [Pilimelia terevasa]|uniref:Ribosome hibernation promoting factor n=1 Tax=Pilimelia terevasa TaxID=53372 RepID=A0A8J3FE56_9ACTN|nr:ribosome-associated translation inhibitor RaiA [Pilimelia terevasa]GGK15445.1 ribosomal subunit interface protein [Pilimelia terevasa]
MEIVVKGRNVEVPEHYREHVAEKLHKVERYDQKLSRIDVELYHERNPRQADNCQRIEITCYTRGPVIRAEAAAKDFYSALDVAIAKVDTRMRRSADRRRLERRHRLPVAQVAATVGAPPQVPAMAPAPEPHDDQPWHLVREKEHPADPMTVDDALFQMELVGHDFYLFLDKESGRPSVVYRRRGYDYGVMSLAAPA